MSHVGIRFQLISVKDLIMVFRPYRTIPFGPHQTIPGVNRVGSMMDFVSAIKMTGTGLNQMVWHGSKPSQVVRQSLPPLKYFWWKKSRKTARIFQVECMLKTRKKRGKCKKKAEKSRIHGAYPFPLSPLLLSFFENPSKIKKSKRNHVNFIF